MKHTKPSLMRPNPITPGQTIGVLSVSAPEPATDAEFFNRGVAAIESAGYSVKLGAHTTQQKGYVTADPASLADDLHALFRDQEVSAVICAGGGINSNRMLKHLKWDVFRDNPKPLVGVSNPTLLLNAITAKTDLVTFHGPSVVWDFGAPDGMPELTKHHFWQMLQFSQSSYELPKQPDWEWIREGDLYGRVIAGNLVSLQSLLGTPYEPDWEGAVLMWEDVAKPVNRLDMMLTHFETAGVFDKISGMVVGRLASCEPSSGVDYPAMLQDLLCDTDIPVLSGLPFGHTPEKFTLPIGAVVQFDQVSQFMTFEW